MTSLAHHSHPVITAVDEVNASLDGVAEVPVWSMGAAETITALDRVEAAEAKLRAAKSRLLVHAGKVEAYERLTVPNGHSHRHKLTRREAHRQTRVAQGLDAHPLLEAAMSAGTVKFEQAEAILAGLATLPKDLAPEHATRAEELLIEFAAEHDAKALKGLARTILEYIDPDAADAHLAKQLEKSEAEDEDANRLHLWETPQGRVRGKFDLDAFSGAAFKKALYATAAPKHRAAQGPLGERLPSAERLGQAFAEYVRRYPKSKLPNAGGLNAAVVVLIDHDTLLGGIKAAKLDTGEHISPGLARRIACEAGIIPAVLGGESEVLDLGRSRRFHSRAQRIVATIEQGGCLEEGCDAAPAFTQMHHPTPWSKGGHTDRGGWMLCPSAHRRVHDPRYRCERLPNGKVRFHRRT